MRIRNIYGFVFAAAIVAIVGCQSEEEKAALREAFLQKQLENRLVDFRNLLSNQCRESALAEAGRLADSILLVEARLSLDTTGRPARPDKPEKPTLKTLLDSTAVKPFFDDSTLRGN